MFEYYVKPSKVLSHDLFFLWLLQTGMPAFLANMQKACREYPQYLKNKSSCPPPVEKRVGGEKKKHLLFSRWSLESSLKYVVEDFGRRTSSLALTIIFCQSFNSFLTRWKFCAGLWPSGFFTCRFCWKETSFWNELFFTCKNNFLLGLFLLNVVEILNTKIPSLSWWTVVNSAEFSLCQFQSISDDPLNSLGSVHIEKMKQVWS